MYNEVCKNCVHCHKTKELVDKEWKESYICTLWLDKGEKQEPLLITLGEYANSLCECIEIKKSKVENDHRPQCCIDHDKYNSTCDMCEFGEGWCK